MAHVSFTGSTPQEAMQKAMAEYGEDIIVVTTKQIKAATNKESAEYEVLFAIEGEVNNTPKSKVSLDEAFSKSHAAAAAKLKAYTSLSQNSKQSEKFIVEEADEGVESLINRAYDQLSTHTNISAAATAVNANTQNIDTLSKQIKQIKEQIDIISDITWESLAANRNNLPIPPEFASIYKASKASGMKSEHLEAIMRATIENMPSSMKANPTAVRRYFYSLLRNMLPCRKAAQNQKQRIIMLVGPTGVGKTTTLAKLAWRFAHGQDSDKRYKTGVITLDTYRIGAVEQLAQYTRIMHVEMIDVFEVEDFKSALKSFSYCDVVLIDTTGSSQHDKEKLLRLDKFLKQSGANIDVTLVLSAVAKVEDLIDTYNNFSFLDIDTLIITKFDETRMFGNVFSLIYETKTPVSYFCVGQDVPDDIMEARSDFLAKCVLDGFSGDSK
ncbi:flagellar biosynthesis protein FlhF [Campylobacter sp. 19-13652]|uniref:flagellar biosynthesis protein FlhF n=1 Tax=Campylobacter sp. 19-13652 TaxID=2840180 RepID=UPI001C77B5F6|nr:flagellar biosynthesis protein FlhF [Campylobacter sp. 19-13652]BCX78882.1 flagellar biosynthesis protein FlhF [Campylobacter sp. 19-13652]